MVCIAGPPAYSVFGLSKEKERCGFMRKVYIILSLQMVVTAGIAASFVLIQPVKRWTLDHYWIVLVALYVFRGYTHRQGNYLLIYVHTRTLYQVRRR